MTDAIVPSVAAPATAGAMLKAARQAQGLHIAALAASIKVTQRKLEALEADRYDELPDLTFTRALAKTVCRTLKIDPGPVLALLPTVGDQGLDRVHQGLNETFRDRPGRLEPSDLSMLARPAVWLPLLIVLVAAGIYLAPQGWIGDLHLPEPAASAPGTPASAAMAATAPASAVEPAVAASDAAASAPPAIAPVFPPEAAPPAEAAASAEMTGTLQLRTSAESWVEVLDASGATLLQRMLQPGEAVGLDGTPPFKVKVGNAAVTQLRFRGQPVDLQPATRDNVARLELK